ncbi:hypothetical protein BSZ35_15990 [Salinibacter sp. 10B]|uniref:DUF2249 domain-containing protein n=1 Tax=Salinibacter sp. 10B TaxID=1923971 RepID=UPI000D2D5934|nr:DUF2249 domain-containing protein [Salinibacter sp. 10B]PQJ35902.1 hypothetical protein BSZ35_15990 [Salinibacter sp. 10B]
MTNSTMDRPDVLEPVTEEDLVDLDVRPILRNGDEPFGKIMSVLQGMREGQVLRLHAPFKPAPLFGVLGAKGWSHWIEYGEEGNWVIWFYRDGGVQ